jgi:hypothetical protein
MDLSAASDLIATRYHLGLILLVGLAAGLLILTGCGAATTGTSGTSSGANAVIVTTDRAVYTPSETVVVTIANHLTTTVLAADHQTSCSIVSLELLLGQTWQRQNPCLLMSPTRLIEIHPGDASVLRMPPPMQAGSAAWPSGTYRVVFAYQMSPTGSATVLPPVPFTVR